MSDPAAPLPSAPTVGLLHPGAMGAVVGGLLAAAGHDVVWCAEGRSPESRSRADAAGLRTLPDLTAVARESDLIVSVVPPHAALDVARDVVASGFAGLYLDANAVSPARSRQIGDVVTRAGARYLDGGIVGPPPARAGTSWLHLSGPEADRVAALFDGTILGANVVSDRIGAASAVKMAFAAWTKGATALRTTVLAYAEAAGVAAQLERQWERLEPGFWQEGRERATRVTAKAWRFEGEMREIADAFEAEGLPTGFHRTAAEVYGRLAPLRTVPSVRVDDVVRALTAIHPDE
jgi:3-hydroxyisobutyrate dehydrogenase-like beta-hydroxyacid dehydrogenase